jgi:hypothetical protein
MLLALLLVAYAGLFWVQLLVRGGGLGDVAPGRAALICLLLGTLALVVEFPAPRTLIVNAFWWPVTLVVVAGVAGALGGRRAAVVTAEAMLVAVLLHAFGRPESRRVFDVERGDGVAWAFSFESAEQRIVKRFPRPTEWEAPTHETFVRVDLAAPYEGRAGYQVLVNGSDLGKVNGYTPDTVWQGPGGYRWAVRVPAEALARDGVVTVELRPDGIDRRLLLAGHGDPLVEALGRDSTWLFDGAGWTRERLAGAGKGPAGGTYRIWLITALKPPAELMAELR